MPRAAPPISIRLRRRPGLARLVAENCARQPEPVRRRRCPQPLPGPSRTVLERSAPSSPATASAHTSSSTSSARARSAPSGAPSSSRPCAASGAENPQSRDEYPPRHRALLQERQALALLDHPRHRAHLRCRRDFHRAPVLRHGSSSPASRSPIFAITRGSPFGPASSS